MYGLPRALLSQFIRRAVAWCVLGGSLGAAAAAPEDPGGPRIERVWVLETPAVVPRDDEARLLRILTEAPGRPVAALDARAVPLLEERWLKLRLVRPARADTGRLLLRVRAAGLREVDAYLVEDGRIAERAAAGHARPLARKEYPAVPLGLRLDRWSDEHADVFLRVVALRHAPLDPAIVTERDLLSSTSANTAVFAAYVGAAILLLLFQSAFFVVFRDAPSREYIFFTLSIFVLGLSRSGYFDHYLGGSGGFLLGEWREHLRLLSAWTGLRTLDSYFDLPSRAPTWSKWVTRFCWAMAPLSLSSSWLPPLVFLQAVSGAQLVAVLLVVGSCGLAVHRGFVGARLVAVSWAPIVVVTISSITNYHPSAEVDPESLITAAMLWEMTFSTVGLGYRLKLLRDDQHQRELKEREAAGLRRMIRVISHDLHTPLAVISLTSQLMARAVRANAPFAIGPAATRLNDAVHAIQEIVDGVRDWSLLREHRDPFLVTPVNLVPLLDETLAIFEQRISDKRLSLSRRYGPEPVWVRGEPRLMRRSIFSNALSNAVKFTPPGGHICLDVARVGEFAEVLIEDSGIGVSEEVIKAFHESRALVKSGVGTEHEYGTGFGLPLMRDFARALGGDAVVEPRAGEGVAAGTRVRLRFQLCDSPSAGGRGPAGVLPERSAG